MHKTTSLFLSHGAPNRILQPHPANEFLQQLGQSKLLTQANAIVIMSAHWVTEQLSISATGTLNSYNDFYGFEANMYKQQYQVQQPQWLTNQVTEVLTNQQLNFTIQSQGLDHGAWTLLKLINPDGRLPVLAISLPILAGYRQGENMSAYIQLGQQLSELALHNIVFIGSGSATHNLSQLKSTGITDDWAHSFVNWLQRQAQSNQYTSLAMAYKTNELMNKAHPTSEHFLPLLVSAGIHYQDHKTIKTQLIHNSYDFANLNNSSFSFSENTQNISK